MDFWKWVFLGLVYFVTLLVIVEGFEYSNVSHISYMESYEVSDAPQPLMVPITLIDGADSKGAGDGKFYSSFAVLYFILLLFL